MAKRRLDPGGLVSALLIVMTIAGLITGFIGAETENWLLRNVGLGLLSPLVILCVFGFFYGLYRIATTSKEDD